MPLFGEIGQHSRAILPILLWDLGRGEFELAKYDQCRVQDVWGEQGGFKRETLGTAARSGDGHFLGWMDKWGGRGRIRIQHSCQILTLFTSSWASPGLL